MQNSRSVEFEGTVDANGYYEITVPADNHGVTYQMKYSTLEITQNNP